MKRLLSIISEHDRSGFGAFAWQFFKFGIVGVSNTAVSLGIYYLFLWIDVELYMAGTVLGTVLSITNAFFWNNKFVFPGSKGDFSSLLKRLGKTYVGYSGTSVLSIVLMWVEINIICISKTLAPIVNLFITIPLNFLINKFWTFAETDGGQSEYEAR